MEPFIFKTSIESVQLTGIRACSLAQLYDGIQKVDGSSIYHHTHHFYRANSFLGLPDRSDFAFWVGNNLKETIAAERMSAMDLRDYHTIEELRRAFLEILEPMRESENRWDRLALPGLEFHFCRSTSLVMPTGVEARNLDDFIDGLRKADLASIYYHLIEAPLHFYGTEKRFNNHFSEWLFDSMGLEKEAQEIADIDPYRFNLEVVRQRLVEVFHQDKLRTAFHRVLQRIEHEEGAVTTWMKHWRKES